MSQSRNHRHTDMPTPKRPRNKPASTTSRRASLTFRAAVTFSCLTYTLLPHCATASSGDSTSTCDASDYKLPQQLIDAATGAGFPGPPQLFGLVASIQAGWDPALGAYETPMSVRFTWLISALNWNCAAAYSADWDDALTQGEPLIRTPESATVKSDVSSGLFSDGTENISLHSTDARFLCAIHGWHAVLTDWVPGAASTLLPVLTNFGLNIGQLGYRDDVGACFESLSSGGSPADTGPGHGPGQGSQNDGGEDVSAVAAACLRTIAEDECYSPATMGQIIGRQLAEYARTDGKMHLRIASASHFHIYIYIPF